MSRNLSGVEYDHRRAAEDLMDRCDLSLHHAKQALERGADCERLHGYVDAATDAIIASREHLKYVEAGAEQMARRYNSLRADVAEYHRKFEKLCVKG